MNRNVELKAKAYNFQRQSKIGQELSDTPQEILLQEDTFFSVHNGRLKLRKFNKTSGELIFYRRTNTPEAKQSSYQIIPTQTPEILVKTLALALGIKGVVTKTRYLYFYGQTRIHFDVVKDIGEFIEFEYVLKPEESIENGKKSLQFLSDKLGINAADLISHAYIDLLLSDQ